MSPANDNRPDGFDAALLAYMPKLRRRARYLTRQNGDAEDLLQEAIVRMLANAANCRMETFKTWAHQRLINTSHVLYDHSRRQSRCAPEISIDGAGQMDKAPLENRCAQLRVEPDQFAKADLAQVVDKLRSIPNGDIVLRCAAGEFMFEIGNENGTTKQAVHQRVEKARTALHKVLDRRAA